jgi:hypothetical protein
MIGLRARSAPWLVFPVSVLMTFLWIGLQRLVWLAAVARYPPHSPQWVNADRIFAFWEFWHSEVGWAGSVQRAMMIVNLLLVLFLWAQLRGRPRGSFRQRSLQLLVFGGSAGLLVYLQYFLARVSLAEPAFRVIRLDLETFLLTAP